MQAKRALTGKQVKFEQADEELDLPGLKDGFDWYMSPSDKSKYQEIYDANRDPHGEIACKWNFDHVFRPYSLFLLKVESLEPLYSSLDVPDTDIRSAWNLINPSASLKISKDPAIAFLHILNNRHEGYRIPRTIPPSLRSSFEQNKIDYQIDNQRSLSAAQRWASRGEDDTSTGRKAKFGDTYLTRMKIGGNSSYRPSGTDFSSTKSNDEWEEVRLKKQLAELEEKIKVNEAASANHSTERRDTKPALVKRELEKLLDYKRNVLRDLERGVFQAKAGTNLKGIGDEIAVVMEQVDRLDAHLNSRRQVLAELEQEIEREKSIR